MRLLLPASALLVTLLLGPSVGAQAFSDNLDEVIATLSERVGELEMIAEPTKEETKCLKMLNKQLKKLMKESDRLSKDVKALRKVIKPLQKKYSPDEELDAELLSSTGDFVTDNQTTLNDLGKQIEDLPESKKKKKAMKLREKSQELLDLSDKEEDLRKRVGIIGKSVKRAEKTAVAVEKAQNVGQGGGGNCDMPLAGEDDSFSGTLNDVGWNPNRMRVLVQTVPDEGGIISTFTIGFENCPGNYRLFDFTIQGEPVETTYTFGFGLGAVSAFTSTNNGGFGFVFTGGSLTITDYDPITETVSGTVEANADMGADSFTLTGGSFTITGWQEQVAPG